MTDSPSRSRPEPSGDEADLLASAYLDNEATSEERARVEADPTLMHRVEEFRTIAMENSKVTPPAGLAGLQIAAALDEFDAMRSAEVGAVATTGEHRPAPVTSLSERRSRRASLPIWLGAAAIAALVVGGLGVIAGGGGGDDEVASVERSPAASAASADDSLADDGEAGDAAAMEAPQAELAEADEALTDASEADMANDSVMEGAAEEESGDRPTLTPQESADFYVENGPVDLAEFEGTTATDFYEQLRGFPLQPLEASPCADSPLVAGLFEIDSFIPVIFDGQQASLVFRTGAPDTALIVGSTCEIALP